MSKKQKPKRAKGDEPILDRPATFEQMIRAMLDSKAPEKKKRKG